MIKHLFTHVTRMITFDSITLFLNMEFISEELDNYVCLHSDEESDLLKTINRETNLEVLRPRMLSGHFQGRVLSMFSKMLRPNSILEIGTYTGYSALCLAEGLSDDGRLVTIDINEELENRVKEYIQKSSFSKQIDYLVGDALEIIPTLPQTWDLVFIDADKPNYQNYYNLVFHQVRVGGVIIFDNVLWSGKVLNELQNDPETAALRKLNNFIKNDQRVSRVLLPVRDGLLVVMKK
jgi:caffeoyl-CoA O-methyltransferase